MAGRTGQPRSPPRPSPACGRSGRGSSFNLPCEHGGGGHARRLPGGRAGEPIQRQPRLRAPGAAGGAGKAGPGGRSGLRERSRAGPGRRSDTLFPRARRSRSTSWAPPGAAAGFSGPCWSGGSCSWDLCPSRTRLWPVSTERGPAALPGPGAALSEPSLCACLSLTENYSAEDKYRIWMRHRYRDCVGYLGELMGHDAFQVKVGPESSADPGVHGGPLGLSPNISLWEGGQCCKTALMLWLTSAHQLPAASMQPSQGIS